MNRIEQAQTVCNRIHEMSCVDIDEVCFNPPSRNTEISRCSGLLKLVQEKIDEGVNDEELSGLVLSVLKNLVVYHACCVSDDTLE